MQRRAFIQQLAAGGLLLGFSGLALGDRKTCPPSQQSWTLENLQKHKDDRMKAISYAVLCPNAHNLQSWRIELSRDGQDLWVYHDPHRRLPASDNPDRQLTISIGCFTELLRMASARYGLDTEISPFPEGHTAEDRPLDNRPVARVHFLRRGNLKPDPLFQHTLARHTNRNPFSREKLPASQQLARIRLSALKPQLVHYHQDPATAAKIRRLVREAYLLEMVDTPATRNELVDLLKLGNAEIADSPWGPSINSIQLRNIPEQIDFSRNSLRNPDSAASAWYRGQYLASVATGQQHLWVATPENTRYWQFHAGREWLRLHLKATALGLSLQPHSQPIHDFTGMMPVRRKLHSALGLDEDERIQMLGRIGFGPTIGPSPRQSGACHLL